MASAVPPLDQSKMPSKGSEDAEYSPRLNESTTPRALWDIVKDDPRFAVLLGDADAGDILDSKYHKYLTEVVPLMESRRCSFKEAVTILAGGVLPCPKDTVQEETKELAKDQHRATPPAKVPEEKQDLEQGHREMKASDARSSQPEAKARNVDVERKSQTDNRRRDQKAAARSSSEPVTPGRLEKEAAEGRPKSSRRPSNPGKSIAIQTEESPQAQPKAQPKEVAASASASSPTPRGGALGLRQPLLAPAPKPKAKQTAKKAKTKDPTDSKYAECSCQRVLYSAAVKWLVFFSASILTGSLTLGFITVRVNSGHKVITPEVTTLPPSHQEPGKQHPAVVPLPSPGKNHSSSSAGSSAGSSGTTAPKEPHSSSSAGRAGTTAPKEHHPGSSAGSAGTTAPKEPVEPKAGTKESTGAPAPAPPAAAKSPAQPGSSHPGAAAKPEDPLKSAKARLHQELKKLSKLEEEEAKTASMRDILRTSQHQDDAYASQSQDKEKHLQRAAMDAEVEAKVAMEELKEDEKIQAEEKKVRIAQQKVEDVELNRKQNGPAHRTGSS